MIDAPPPHNADIERAVIGAMMISGEAINEAAELVTPETFYIPVYQILYRAITDMHTHDIPIDQLSLSDYLEQQGYLRNVGGEASIASMMNEAVTAANIKYHCGIINRSYLLRKLLTLSKQIENSCYKTDAEPERIKDDLVNAMFSLSKGGKFDTFYTMMDTMLKATNDIARLMESRGSLRGLATGYKFLDKQTDGLKKGNLIIVAGLPETGKTTFALNMAANIAKRDIPVGIFSMEMTVEELGGRLLATAARKNLSAVGREVITQSSMRSIMDSGNRLSKYPIYIDVSSALTHMNLYARIQKMQRQHNVQVVFIDHLQLMRGAPEYKGNIRMEITDITRNLKNYAKMLDIPVVIISHLRKSAENENHRPVLSDLKESGSIGEDADLVVVFHRPKVSDIINKFSEKGKILNEIQAEHIVELLVRKNRGGATGILYLHWEPTYTLFSDLEL